MSAENTLSILWRRKWIVALTVLVATLGTYFIARSLPKVYTAEATLFVGDRGSRNSDFEALQSAQVLAKTYAELIQSEAVAEEVAAATPDPDDDADELLGKMEFKPVTDTQLIVIAAEGSSPAEAAGRANTYGRVFVDYARQRLASQTQSELTLADEATEPGSATRPRPALYAAIAFVASLFLGGALALLRDRLDTRFGDDEQISRELEVPVLARVPTAARRGRDPVQAQHFLETFRVLRTNLRFLRPSERMSSFLVTSAGASEGKSTSAMALARSFAEQGDRVVILEGDLRRPSLLEQLKQPPDRLKGVVQYLVLDSTFDEVVHETSVLNVFVVPAGVVPPNPSVLLQTDGLRDLVNDAGEFADVVIIDSPPLSAGADASILANAVDAILFVVNFRHTRRTRAIQAVRQLRQAGGDIAGLIINEVSRGDQYDAYYYAASETVSRGEKARSG